jgi:hypothetical protein
MLFSNTISKIQQNSDEIWKFEKLKLICQYDENSHLLPLPPPFNLINYGIKIIKSFKKCDNHLEDITDSLAEREIDGK